MQNSGCQSACFGFCREMTAAANKHYDRKRRNGDDLTVAPELQLLNESIKKTFTHRNDSDGTKSVGRLFKEDPKWFSRWGAAFYLELLVAGRIWKERTCHFGSASLGAVISGEPCSAHTLPGGHAALPRGRTSCRVQRPESLLSTKAPGV